MKSKARRFTTKQNLRRGIAMEMAISVLMITFALSTLIVSVAMLEVDKLEQSIEVLEHRTRLEQLGQNFCAAVAADDLNAWKDSVTDYRVSVTGAIGDSTVTLQVHPAEENPEESAIVLLQVVLQKKQDTTGYTVTQWSYR